MFNHKGCIHKASVQFKQLLLEKSIYDILADVWYFPRLSIYIKALFGPLII